MPGRDPIDLNAADGRKTRTLAHRHCGLGPRKLIERVREFLALEWQVAPETLEFSQNISTHVAQVANLVGRGAPVGLVMIDRDEVPWTAQQFSAGRTIDEAMTYPNFAPLKGVKVRKQRVVTLDCRDLESLDSAAMGNEVNILVLCQVSRTTGTEIPVQRFYRRWKADRPQDVVIVDGAQVLAARSVSVADLADVYLSVSSKFLGAQPNLGFAYLSPGFRDRYCRGLGYPVIRTEDFYNELASCFTAWRDLPSDYEEAIRRTRHEADEIFRSHGLPVVGFPDQVAHIATIQTDTGARARWLHRALGDLGVKVFHNLDYSLVAPEVPCLRLSISARNRLSDIERFVQAYGAIEARLCA